MAWGDQVFVTWNPDKVDRWKGGGVDSRIPELSEMSLSMLNPVRNWYFYQISLVHLLFPKVIYISIHIFLVL